MSLAAGSLGPAMLDPSESTTARAREGRGSVVARWSGGATRLVSSLAGSPLRLVQPTFAGTKSASVCLVTFGGGLVDGDRIELDITVEAGATLIVFTQSSTKVFRGRALQTFRANVAGRLVLLPDPVAAFADAYYMQRVDVDLTGSGSCVLLDGYTSGRAAFGERWAMNGLDLRTTVTQDGRLVVRDALRLVRTDGSIADRSGRFEAFLTAIAVGEGARPIIDGMGGPVAPPTDELVVAASPLPRAVGAIVRAAARSPAGALAAVRSRLRNLPDIDAVDPFASRY